MLYAYIILACQTTFLYIPVVIENLAGFSSCSQYFQLWETHTFWMFKRTSWVKVQFTLGNEVGNNVQSCYMCVCVAIYRGPLVHLDGNLLAPEQYLMLQRKTKSWDLWKSSEVTAFPLNWSEQKNHTGSVVTMAENEVFLKFVCKSLSFVNHLNFNID